MATPVLQPIALTVREAVIFSRIGKTKLYELMASGQIESVKVDGRRLVSTESLRAYFARLQAEQIGRAA
ncbi:MAG: helix-turn-helix domain-containing protein [Streptomyces sp.]|jgi:hypothetical protein